MLVQPPGELQQGRQHSIGAGVAQSGLRASAGKHTHAEDASSSGPLDVVEAGKALGAGPVAVACATIEDARWAALAAEDAPGTIRAIVGPAIPGGLVSALSGAGVYALASKEAAPKKIDVAAATAGKAEAWLARGVERAWTQGRPAAAKR